MTQKNKTLSAIFASILSLLAAWGIYKPTPVPSPTPSPTATATATPEPTSTATPIASPLPTPSVRPTPPGAATCRLPPSSGGCDFDGLVGRGEFGEAVFMAQEQAKDNGYLVPGGQVKDEALYTNEVARLLRLDGYCAINGREGGHTSSDEVWLKFSNQFSLHYDIIRADGIPILIYAARCTPAKFD